MARNPRPLRNPFSPLPPAATGTRAARPRPARANAAQEVQALTALGEALTPSPTAVLGGEVDLSHMSPEATPGQNEGRRRLGEEVRKAYRVAASNRRTRGIDDLMMKALRAYRNEYNPDDPIAQPNDVYMGVTSSKCRAFKSWITDVLTNAEDQPWTLKPTPRPDLSPEAVQQVQQKLLEEVATYGLNFDVRKRAAELLSLAQVHVDKLSAEKAERMELTIRDRLLEGGWRGVFDEFVADLALYPAAIIKGPIVASKPVLKWTADETVEVVQRDLWVLKRVDPFRFYPSPNSTCPNSGGYIIERMATSPSELADFMDLPFFDQAAIRAVFSQYPHGFRETDSGLDLQVDVLQGTKTNTTEETDANYDVLLYYGVMKGDTLLEAGVQGDFDRDRTYEIEAWVCAGYVLRAILNPNPMGTRPYYATSLETVPGSFWGRSIPELLADIQRVANASVRSLVRNMAFSSGPMGEYDADRIQDEAGIEELAPYKLFAVSSDRFNTTPSPAVRFYTPPNIADSLQRLYEYFLKQADEVSGIPAYVMGSPSVQGAGRTLGGLSMLMSNAARGLKAVVANVDKQITEPLVTAYYNMEMLFGDDPTVKGDCQIVARGASGLLQRELSQSRAVEALQMLVPFTQVTDKQGRPVIPADGLRVVIADILKSLGYTAEQIMGPAPDRVDELQAFGAQGDPLGPQGQPPQARPPGPGTMMPTTEALSPSQPRLDGRSAAPSDPGAQAQLPAD